MARVEVVADLGLWLWLVVEGEAVDLTFPKHQETPILATAREGFPAHLMAPLALPALSSWSFTSDISCHRRRRSRQHCFGNRC